MPTGSYARIWFDSRRARQNRAEHLLLANPPRDQLRVLPAEIEHDDAAAFTHRFFPIFILSIAYPTVGLTPHQLIMLFIPQRR